MSNGDRVRLPFTLLTNGGGDTEKARTDLVNRRMFGRTAPQGEDDLLLDPSQMICCHTPLRRLVPEFKDKYVLVTGNKDVMSVCQEYGYTKAIHAEELYALMPYLCPLAMKEFPEDRRQ